MGGNTFFYSQGDVSAETAGKFKNPLNFEGSFPNQDDIWIFATDLDGTMQWNQLYGGESNDRVNSTIYNPQSLYVAASTQSSGYDVGDRIGNYDSWIFKLFAKSTTNCNEKPTAQPQIFCTTATVSNLVATGSNLQWYATATGGSVLASDVALTSGTYYVSQTLDSCESTRTEVAVSVQAAPNAGTNGTLTVCAGTIPSESELFAVIGTHDQGGTWTNSGLVYTYTVNPTSPCATAATVTVTEQATLNAGTDGTPAVAVLPFDVMAYPNPFTTTFNLELITTSTENVAVNVYDAIGKLVETRNLPLSEVGIQEVGTNYPTGTYTIMVVQGDNVKTLRVIKR